MFRDYCDLLTNINDVVEDLVEMRSILYETKLHLINRTFATAQNFHLLATKGKYQRLKDRNRRKRVHFFTMCELLNRMDIHILCWMIQSWGITHIKVEYKRGQQPVFLNMKNYIDRRIAKLEARPYVTDKFCFISKQFE